MAIAETTDTQGPASPGANGGATASINTTGANLIVVGVCSLAGVTPNLSDSKGNTWTPLTSQSSTFCRCQAFYAINPTVGSGHTFTSNATGSYPTIEVLAFSGADISAPFDVQNGANSGGSSVTSLSTGSVTPTTDGQVVVSFISADGSGGAFTTGLAVSGSLTIAHSVDQSANQLGAASAYRIETTATAVNPGWSWTNADGASAVVATFKAASATLVAGTASFSSSDGTSIFMTATAASGGTAPITEVWQKTTTSGASFSSMSNGSGNSGVTTLNLTDGASLIDGTNYYYRVAYTDATPTTVYSNQVAGNIYNSAIKIGFIGDSITNVGAIGNAINPSTACGDAIARLRNLHTVTISNQGHNGAATTDWTSGSTYLNNAKTAFSGAGITFVHVMLGFNDAAASVSAATYKSNLSSMLTDLTGAGYTVMLSYPIWSNPAGGSGADAYTNSLAGYLVKIDELVNGTTILAGDHRGWNYFATHVSQLQSDGVHITDAGATALGEMWAGAIDRYLNPNSGSVAGFSRIFTGF